MNGKSLLFSICFLFVMSCRMSGITLNDVSISERNELFNKTISVHSTDKVAAVIVCDSIRRSKYFKDVYCQTEREQEKYSDYDLFVTTKINNPSLDYGRNVALSLASLTTYAAVSVSADTDFFLTVRRKNRLIYEKRHSSRARIGMWAILPVWAGFFGTTIGTVLNSHKHPVRMQRECLRGIKKKNLHNGEVENENCGNYREFITHGYNKIYFGFLQNLISATNGFTREEVLYENRM